MHGNNNKDDFCRIKTSCIFRINHSINIRKWLVSIKYKRIVILIADFNFNMLNKLIS